MNAIRRIKNNLFVRNCWILANSIKKFFRGKYQFAECADNVTITPPIIYVILRMSFLALQ